MHAEEGARRASHPCPGLWWGKVTKPPPPAPMPPLAPVESRLWHVVVICCCPNCCCFHCYCSSPRTGSPTCANPSCGGSVQILVTPFLKKYIYTFIKDIVDRFVALPRPTLPVPWDTQAGVVAMNCSDSLCLYPSGSVACVCVPSPPAPLHPRTRTSSIGEGTAMFKDAAVHLASASGAVPAALETSLGAHSKALYDQLKALGLEVRFQCLSV